MSISVILPAYKEAENLRVLLPKIDKALKKIDTPYEILVVDTMEAMDDTPSICMEFHALYKNRRNGNHYGDAIRTGIADARFEQIVIMDADGSHNPEDITRFYQEIKDNHYDLVIGSRYIKGGDTHNSFILKAMSFTLNVVYRMFFHLNIKDVSNSFRMYHAEKLKAIQLECKNFDIVEEILIRLQAKFPVLSVKEIPIYFNKRNYGESKRDLIKFIFSYITTMFRLYKIKKSGNSGSV